MPDYMQDQFIKPTKNHPWAAPGTAPIYGEGCGVNGGNPNGCGWGRYSLKLSQFKALIL